jgi:hypothetical protein
MARWGEDSALRDSGRNGECISARVLLHVVLAATMGEFLGVHGQYTVDLTADEWAYAAAVGGVTEVLDTTTLAGFELGGGKWDSIVLADNVGKLFAAPRAASAVLIIDPVTNTTDNTTLGGLGSGIDKWIGISYAVNVGKLFAAPFRANAVLIVDPIFNTTDITTLGGLGSGSGKWAGITYVVNVGKQPVCSTLFQWSSADYRPHLQHDRHYHPRRPRIRG